MALVMQDLHFRPCFSNSSKRAVLNGDKAVALHGVDHILGCACNATASRTRGGGAVCQHWWHPVDSAGPV